MLKELVLPSVAVTLIFIIVPLLKLGLNAIVTVLPEIELEPLLGLALLIFLLKVSNTELELPVGPLDIVGPDIAVHCAVSVTLLAGIVAGSDGFHPEKT